MTEEMFVVDLYIRVSTDRQAKEGDSLEEQENELTKYCSYRNFKVHKVYVERGKSGGTTNRPEYQKLVQDIESKKVNAVVVKKLDRLSRSLLDFEQLMLTMQSCDVEFVSLRENFDTTTAMGKAMLRVALVFAQLEREQTSERIKDVMDYRASQGLFNGGKVPFGYNVIDKELVPYKKEKEIVKLIFAKFLELKSTAGVAQLLNSSKIPTRKRRDWIDTQIQTILQNPVYTGQVVWKKQTYEGLHPPIIGHKTFEKVQAVFKQTHYLHTSKRVQALFKKLLHCGVCQRVMTVSSCYSRTKTKYYYYKCTSLAHKTGKQSNCPIRQINLERFESKVLDILANLADGSQFQKVQSRIQDHNHEVRQEEIRVQSEIQAIEAKIAALTDKKDSFLSSLVTSKFLSNERKQITERVDQLDNEMRHRQVQKTKLNIELSQTQEEYIEAAKLHELALLFADVSELDFEQRRMLMMHHVTQIECYLDKVLIQFADLPWPVAFPVSDIKSL